MSLLIRDPVLYGGASPTMKSPVRAATTTAGTLASSFTAGSTVDGIALALGDRILIKNQASSTENGLYVVQTSGAPLRTQDLPTGTGPQGVTVYITSGTTNGAQLWTCTTTVLVGAGAMNFSRSDALGILSVARGGTGTTAAPPDGWFPVALTGGGSYSPTVVTCTDGSITIDPEPGSQTITLVTPLTIAQGGTGVGGDDADPLSVLVGNTSGGNYIPGEVAGANFQLNEFNQVIAEFDACSLTSYSIIDSDHGTGAGGAYALFQNYDYNDTPEYDITGGSIDSAGEYLDVATSDSASNGVLSNLDGNETHGVVIIGPPFATTRGLRFVNNADGKGIANSLQQEPSMIWSLGPGSSLQCLLLDGNPAVDVGYGSAVSVSADGYTAIFTEPSSNQGFVVTFINSDAGWNDPTTLPTATGLFGDDNFGHSCALSANGLTAAFGSPSSNSNVGAVWIYTSFSNGDGTFTQQAGPLVGTGGSNPNQQGTDVALNADGNTLVSGAPFDSTNLGGFYVFFRTGTSWAQQGTFNVPTGLGASPHSGISIRLSGDGNTCIISGVQAGASSVGGFSVWQRTPGGSSWSQFQAFTSFAGSTGNSCAGACVAISSDSLTIVVGGPNDNTNTGALWPYTRTAFGQTYTLQGSRLISLSGSKIGTTVAISGPGNTIFTGSPNQTTLGSVYGYMRTNGIWSLRTTTNFLDNTHNNSTGTGIYCDGDGKLLAQAAPNESSGVGAIFIFT